MSTILEKITKQKKVEVELKKQLFPLPLLTDSVFFERSCHSLQDSLEKNDVGIIAEHKRRSPSKSAINTTLFCNEVVKSYEEAGVAGCSILTDGSFFGGSLEDLQYARASVQVPLLRKDFIIDEYQILEAKANGADAILLIAAILNPAQVKMFSRVAKELGMEVLLEVHSAQELEENLQPEIQLVGVNNRNLKTFEVSTAISKQLAASIPEDRTKISESGLNSVDDIISLREYGYRGFLIGENFMKSQHPGQMAQELIMDFKAKTKGELKF